MPVTFDKLLKKALLHSHNSSDIVGSITGTVALTDTRIAFGSDTNTVTESADLTWNDTTKSLLVNGLTTTDKVVVDSGDTNGIQFGTGAKVYQDTSGDVWFKNDVVGDFEVFIDNQLAGQSAQLLLKSNSAVGFLAAFSDTFSYANWRNKFVIGTGGAGQGLWLNSDADFLVNAAGYNAIHIGATTRGVGLYTYGTPATATLEVKGENTLNTHYVGKFTDSNKLELLGIRNDGNIEISANGNIDIKGTATKGLVWSGNNVSIKSPSAGILGFYSGANQTFSVASSYVSFGGNLFANVNNSFDLGTSATAFRGLYAHNMYLRTLPTLDNANDVVLVRNATTGKIDYRSASTLTPSLTTNYIGYGSGGNTVTGSPDFTWNNAAKELYVNGKGYFGGVNGVAKLNITASGIGGASEGLSVYDNGGNKKAFILDNGNTEIKGTLSVQESGLIKVNSSLAGSSSNVEVQRSGVTGIMLHSSDGTNPGEYNRLYFNKYLEVRDINASDYMVAYNQTGNWTLNKAANNHFGQLGLWGTARMNVYASNNNGGSAIFSGYNSDGVEKFIVLDNGDISTKGNVSTDIAKSFIIGDGTDGSWQMILSGADFLIQKKESGVWVTKSTITA